MIQFNFQNYAYSNNLVHKNYVHFINLLELLEFMLENSSEK